MINWIVGIGLVILIVGIIYFKKYLFKARNERIHKKYDEDVTKINGDISEKVKHDEAEGMRKAEEIRAKAIKNSDK